MTIRAKFPGTCPRCGQPIQVGDSIEWERGRRARHTTCPQTESVGEVASTEPTIRLRGGSGYGDCGWDRGQVLPNPHVRRARALAAQHGVDDLAAHVRPWLDEPEYLVVVSTSSRYISEDGMSFGVGDESGHVYSATCRAATEEESAALRAADEAAAVQARQRTEAEATRRALADEIRSRGEHPEPTAGQIVPEGDVLSDRQDIYGGGDWFVVGADWIWHVRNNGHDGDDWSANNVRTGGAGAVGYRLAYDADLAERIRAMAAALQAAGKR